MEIRTARPSDGESVREVHSTSIEELGLEGYTQKQVTAWARGCESADYSTAIESNDLQFVVAEVEGDVVGFGSVTFDAPETYETEADAEVTGVYAHPAVARSGVGTEIYVELERRARARDVQTLGLSATLNAVPFYEFHGYERVREYTHEFSSHESTGVTGTVVEMRKEL
ncbi:GNAT family N-acetyltransferase [Haladaptatus sp. NG-WS-4]